MGEFDGRLRCYRPIMDLVFPRICVLCRTPIVEADCESICADCIGQITATEQRCLRCSAPQGSRILYGNADRKSCYYCERRKWSFRRALCYTAYSGTAARVAKKIKQPAHEALAILFGNRIGDWLKQLETVNTELIDIVVPVPQHWFRRITIRYNQADVLAENIAKRLGLALNRHCLFRTRWTEKQGTKSIADRLNGVRNSFACRPSTKIAGKRILLVDDVVTSGATAHDAARALRAAGARRVEVAAFARGVGAFDKSVVKSLKKCDE